MKSAVLVILLALAIGCSGGSSGSGPGSSPTWSISIDTTGTSIPLNPALLGHYDLSGVLYDYPDVLGLVSLMGDVGFAEWRIGSGRWEQATELLDTLTDLSPCVPLPGIISDTATTDAELMAARDWFTYTDGNPVTLLDTADDGRYYLDYIRAVIDTAELFGAAPFVSIDHMPRALSINQSANRVNCGTTFMNAVSNNRPLDVAVFASAVTGLVQRVVEGTGPGSAGPRTVFHWEVWNEPELPYFWAPDFVGQPALFFDMATAVLISLDAYRTSSSNFGLKFGLGSFAFASTAIVTLEAFDTVPIPMDFISFHGYNDDPLVIVNYIEQVAAAAQDSTNYNDIDIILAEWGPDLATRSGDQAYAEGMGPPLHAATVIALGAAAGLDQAHHALFYDYHAAVALGLVDNNGQPRTLYRGYEMMAKVIFPGAVRLAPTGLADGKLDAGMGAVLVSRDSPGAGTIRALLVNRNASERTVTVELDSVATTPATIYAFDGSDDPVDSLRTISPTGPDVVLPANSLMVLEF